MAALSGKGGTVYSGTDKVAFVEEWTTEIADEALETTGLGDTVRSYIGRGLPTRNFSFTFRGLDMADTGSLAFYTQAATNSGAAITLHFYTTGTTGWSGNGIVTSFSASAGIDGLVSGSCSGVISGAWTYA